MQIRRFKERTTRRALVTATGVAAVVLAGAFAVSANVGILDAAGDNKIGSLSAAGDLLPVSSPSSATTADSTAPAAGAQDFVVDEAGTVTVRSSQSAITLDEVVPNTGWTWSPGPADAGSLTISFTDGTRTLVFTAARAADGTIAADVEETVTATPGTTPGPGTTPSPGTTGDDGEDDRYDDGSDDKSDDDSDDKSDDESDDGRPESEAEDQEHEGRDDDD